MLPPCLEFGDERQRVKGSPLADALYPSILLTILGVEDKGNSSAPRQEPLDRNLTVLPHRSCDYQHMVGARGVAPEESDVISGHTQRLHTAPDHTVWNRGIGA